MTTVVLGEAPTALEEWLAERRRLGLDARDEVWEGVLHVAPYATEGHGEIEEQISERLNPRARAAGLIPAGRFNLGERGDHRVPDGGFKRVRGSQVYVPTAAIVVEILSPGDETFEKFDFYAGRGVEELLVVDPQARTVRCWQLREGQYGEEPRSALLDVDTATLQAELDWP